MYSIGDLIIYSGHGICRVDDICDKTYAGMTKTYYILSPIENAQQLTISTPVDNPKTVMMKLIEKEEAQSIIESFHLDGIDWIERPQLRTQVYSNIINTGNRMDIAKVANTLLKKKQEVEHNGRKFYDHDNRLLTNIENILFKELSIALHTSPETISETIVHMINQEE